MASTILAGGEKKLSSQQKSEVGTLVNRGLIFSFNFMCFYAEFSLKKQATPESPLEPNIFFRPNCSVFRKERERAKFAISNNLLFPEAISNFLAVENREIFRLKS